jgi:hypothetical protein
MVTKREANYRVPRASTISCGVCVNFISNGQWPGSCTEVRSGQEGIDPDGLCDLFT